MGMSGYNILMLDTSMCSIKRSSDSQPICTKIAKLDVFIHGHDSCSHGQLTCVHFKSAGLKVMYWHC